jgi:hypothetical protein
MRKANPPYELPFGAERPAVGVLRSFEIMASVAGSRPTSGGNKFPDDVADQNANEKNACQRVWCGQLHEMKHLPGSGPTS